MKHILIAALISISFTALAEPITEPNYRIKQTSTGGSVRYNKTTIAVGSDTSLAAPIQKTESTVITTWTTDDYYYTRTIDGSKTINQATPYKVNFVKPQQTMCEIQDALIYDPTYAGIKLEINPTITDPFPCYYAKLEKLSNGKYVWKPYSAKQPDGSCR